MYNRRFIRAVSILAAIFTIYLELYSFKLIFMMFALAAETMTVPPSIVNSCRFHLVVMSFFAYAYEVILYLLEYGDSLEKEGVEVWKRKRRKRRDKD